MWNAHSVTYESKCMCIYLQRLKDQYVQKWRERCYSSSKLSFYINFKSNFDFQNYLDVINVGKFRRALTTFRTSSHCLMIEKGRHLGLDRAERLCPLCCQYVETEYHFILECKGCNDLRLIYIPTCFCSNPTIAKVKCLMSQTKRTVIKKLGMYIFYSL